MDAIIKRNNGFTLVELMVVIAISSLVMAGIYMTFKNQQNSYLIQEEVTAMQQNVRSGIFYLESEIRMAGYNFAGTTPAPSITAATADSITFQKQRDRQNAAIDTHTYSYDAVNRTLDRELNGGGAQPVAEEIEDLGFAYAYDADDNGRIDTYTDATGEDRIIWAVPSGGNWFNLDTNNDGVIDDNDSPNPGVAVTENIIGVDTGDSVDLDQIRAVRISLLARTGRGDKEYYNNNIYIVGDQKIPPRNDGDPSNDDCRMRLLTAIVNCRNMGL